MINTYRDQGRSTPVEERQEPGSANGDVQAGVIGAIDVDAGTPFVTVPNLTNVVSSIPL